MNYSKLKYVGSGMYYNGLIPAEFHEINKVRKSLGAPEIVIKKRECLHCRKEMVSHGYENRLCSNCRSRDHG